MSLKLFASALAIALLLAAPARLVAQDPPGRFHHVHLNVTDPKASIRHYVKFFSAVPVKFRGVSDALLTDRSYFLLNTVDEPAATGPLTSIWHLGWGGIDGPSEYQWRTDQGIEWETGIQSLGRAHYMYAYGPDREIVEIYTGTPYNRYNHIHLLAADVNVTRDWYIDNIGGKGRKNHIPNPGNPPEELDRTSPALFRYLWSTSVKVDGVTMNIFGEPGLGPVWWWQGDPVAELAKTDGHVVDHYAFSYADIAPVYERMKANGVEIVEEIAWIEELKMKSFFVRAPDGVLVEIVEANPLPDASWMDHVEP